ncbi:MAG: helix-turn-helix domain-containing protein [Acidimicrobiales bacterium]|jgi:predicted ArsR family transcriptional regulator|nr:helix-turn-helix domain-containing protein [Acidimicrobiales bacterium]
MENTSLDHAEFASIVTAITGAFGDPTRREIYLHIRECEEGTNASQIAEKFSLHPNVARHHLDKLLSGGYLEVSLKKSMGSTAGRPSKTYKISNSDQPLNLDVRRDSILISLLARTLSLLPSEEAEKLAEEVGSEVGRSMAESLGIIETQRSFRSATDAIVDALISHGFSARAEQSENGQLRILSEHCPFGSIPIEHPVICAVDRGLVRGMLSVLYGDVKTDLTSSLPMGNEVCVTEVSI